MEQTEKQEFDKNLLYMGNNDLIRQFKRLRTTFTLLKKDSPRLVPIAERLSVMLKELKSRGLVKQKK